MEYKNYLKTEHWRSIREERLKKDNFKCYLCDSKIKLNVHHVTYRKKDKSSILFNESNGHLLTLCEDCHLLYHKIFGYKKLKNSRRTKIRNLLDKGIEKDKAFKYVFNGNYRKAKKFDNSVIDFYIRKNS